MLLNYYLEKLDVKNMPEFLVKYLSVPSLQRLKKVSYFCGMDYASKDIYDFSEYISRFDHSLTVALMTYKLTKNKEATLAGLFHDVSTPCFSHVIDYMNGDFYNQESTEEYTELIIRNDKVLSDLLNKDGIEINDIINFKKYSVVDNDRPKMCVDRLDGVILTGLGWTKDITKNDIDLIVDDMCLYKNEYNELEVGFKSFDVAKRVYDVSLNINDYCHTKEDNYMMQLLATITKCAISKGYFSYNDLYIYNEEYLFNILNNINDLEIKEMVDIFLNIKKRDIPNNHEVKTKIRDVNPIIRNKRLK